ncbi:MAG: EAL domain-containing protein, partial [Oscillospiraceae bacterium]|nr:EAL domain-containing protein [Oscillospiraceae bacterium]
LFIIYFAASRVTGMTATSHDVVSIAGFELPIYAFAGVLSSVSNICVILLTTFCGKKGYFTSLAALSLQIPIIIMSVIKGHNLNSLPGIFSNILAIIAVTTIFFYNRKADKIQKELRRQAVTDALTGLPNAYAVTALLGDLIKHHKNFINVTINLNNIKNLNDTMGYEAGNTVIAEVSKRWKELSESDETRTHDFISYLSGGEYALVIRDYHSCEEALDTIRMYEKALHTCFTIDGCDMFITASFGYAEFPTDADTLNSVCTYSSAAMHEVKRTNSSNHILRFTPDLIKKEHTIEIEGKIRSALENDNIFFNLQPQFDMSHNLRGFEALARIRDTDGNVISPGDFIPVAEKVGLVDKIDAVIFRKSAEFFGEAVRKYGLDITLSVNISVRHLMKNDFLDEVHNIIRQSGIEPRQLEIEITESIMIESVDKALQCINGLAKMGVKIAIDDFGTGYSSLSYLHKFPANLLKIDKSFIDKMNMSKSSKEYVAAIISIGHILGFDVISEGVEEEAQLETLREINCDYIQGFIWGRPLMPDAAEELIRKCAADAKQNV